MVAEPRAMGYRVEVRLTVVVCASACHGGHSVERISAQNYQPKSWQPWLPDSTGDVACEHETLQASNRRPPRQGGCGWGFQPLGFGHPVPLASCLRTT